jgi:hypothetical protein
LKAIIADFLKSLEITSKNVNNHLVYVKKIASFYRVIINDCSPRRDKKLHVKFMVAAPYKKQKNYSIRNVKHCKERQKERFF